MANGGCVPKGPWWHKNVSESLHGLVKEVDAPAQKVLPEPYL